ncbi:hypothetical protein FACS189434_11400 [Bacteroidia bacterium]|nr:hypothetical protein FACS189434_11400 [Bacteroidia bacterium]
MKQFLSILFILFVLSSCCSKTKQIKSLLLGEWKYDSTIDTGAINKIPPGTTYLPQSTGYHFFNNGTCEARSGFLKWSDEDVYFYLGNKTNYKISDDCLQIYNLSSSIWEEYKIISLSSDTLVLMDNKRLCYQYLRFRYEINPNESYDEIILSIASCGGNFLKRGIWVSRTGEVVYCKKRDDSTIDDLYSGKITEAEFIEIENAFKKCNLLQMKDDYDSDVADCSGAFITFIKDKEIAKCIRVCCFSPSKEFDWAYTPLVFLFQKLQLTPIDSTNVFRLDGRHIYEREEIKKMRNLFH